MPILYRPRPKQPGMQGQQPIGVEGKEIRTSAAPMLPSNKPTMNSPAPPKFMGDPQALQQTLQGGKPGGMLPPPPGGGASSSPAVLARQGALPAPPQQMPPQVRQPQMAPPSVPDLSGAQTHAMGAPAPGGGAGTGYNAGPLGGGGPPPGIWQPSFSQGPPSSLPGYQGDNGQRSYTAEDIQNMIANFTGNAIDSINNVDTSVEEEWIRQNYEDQLSAQQEHDAARMGRGGFGMSGAMSALTADAMRNASQATVSDILQLRRDAEGTAWDRGMQAVELDQDKQGQASDDQMTEAMLAAQDIYVDINGDGVITGKKKKKKKKVATFYGNA